MLNQIAAKFLDATTDICPNWKTATPDPMVTVGVMCEGFPIEMIVRGYLCGSAWRAYKSGVREICGVKLPEGMKENQKFPEPIITPTTKAEIGEHDADISKEEILAKGLATPEEYAILEKYTMALFNRGTEIAAERGLILVDTKYEFCKHNYPEYQLEASIAWIEAGMSLKKLPAEKVKTKRQVPPENWQVLYGQYKENLRLCFLPVNEETNQGYWFGFESEIQKPEPVFKAMN